MAWTNIGGWFGLESISRTRQLKHARKKGEGERKGATVAQKRTQTK